MSACILTALIEALNANTAALKAAGGAAPAASDSKPAGKTASKTAVKKVTAAQASAKVTEVKEKFGVAAARAALTIDGVTIKLAEVNDANAEVVLKQAEEIIANGGLAEEEDDV